jgi:hypothetical protein
MAKTVYFTTGIKGGGSNLDGIDGNNIVKGDAAFVRYTTGTNTIFAVYWATTQNLAESAPGIIRPDVNAGSWDWVKMKKHSTST